MSSLDELWIPFGLKKLQWAYEARNKFIENISHQDVKNYLQGDAKKRVAILYGKPQVGKTTLILTLMGVKEDSFAELQCILRAGRESGNSSTSTAIRYGYSDEDWYWRTENEEFGEGLKDTDIIEKLGKVREEISNNRMPYEINIGIPKKYFEKTYNIEIVDLPGVDSRDTGEKGYVGNLIGRYLLESNLTIVVTKATDVQGIKKFKLNGQFDWSSLPGYRVVATRTYEADSIRKHLGTKISVDKLKNIYALDLKGCMNGIKVYPLDFGDSFLELFKCDAQKYNNIKEARDALLEELRNDISTSYSEYEKLTRSFKISNLFKEEIEKKNSKKIKLQNTLTQTIDEHKKKLEKHKKQICIIEKSRYVLKMEGYLRLSDVVEPFSDKLTKENLEEYFNGQNKKLKEAYKKYIDNNSAIRQKADYIRLFNQEWERDEYREVRSSITERRRYFGRGSKDGEEAFKVVSGFAKKIDDEVNQKITTHNREEQEKHSNNSKSIEYRIKKELESRDSELSECDKNRTKLTENIKLLEKEISELRADAAMEFDKFLEDAYSDERNKTIKEINDNPQDDVRNLLRIAYLNIIDEEYQKIKKGGV